MAYSGNTPVRITCLNCDTKITAWRDEKGMTKSKCPCCGTVTVSKLRTRRHIQLDIYAPEGQEVIL